MSLEDNCAVYMHVNLINGKKYFGITTQNPPENRWQNGNGYYRNAHFMNAVKKYGWDNFGHFILYKNIPVAIAKNIEEMLIMEHMSYDSNFGYNKTMGGELERPSEEARRKNSEAHKGKTLSEEHRRSLSNAMSERLKNNPELNPNPPKPVEAIDPESGNRVLYFKSTMDAERAGFDHSHITKCCKGKIRTHAGLMWRYVEEVNDNDSDN